MNRKQLKYVLVLSTEGSFSKAAQTLHISQPSLSQYVKNIEKELGLDLFVRASGNVRLTEAGRIYIDAGRKILDIEQQMHNALVDVAQDKKGKIVIGISPHRSVHLMPYVVKQFHELYPGIQLVLDERSGRELMEAEVRGEFDLCVTTLPVDEKTFDYTVIMKEEVVLAVPAGSPLDRKLRDKVETIPERKFPAVDIHLIDGCDFITLGELMPMKIISDSICKEFDLNLNYKVEVRSNEALITVVNSGIGASLIPCCLVNFNENPEQITYYSIKQDIPLRDIIVITRKDQYVSKPINDLIEILKTLK